MCSVAPKLQQKCILVNYTTISNGLNTVTNFPIPRTTTWGFLFSCLYPWTLDTTLLGHFPKSKMIQSTSRRIYGSVMLLPSIRYNDCSRDADIQGYTKPNQPAFLIVSPCPIQAFHMKYPCWSIQLSPFLPLVVMGIGSFKCAVIKNQTSIFQVTTWVQLNSAVGLETKSLKYLLCFCRRQFRLVRVIVVLVRFRFSSLFGH